MIFIRIRGGNVNLEPVLGKSMCHVENPSKLSTTIFLSSLLNHLFYQKVVEVVIVWKGKSMGKFELGRAPSFGMSCFSCMDKKTPGLYASLDPCIHVLD